MEFENLEGDNIQLKFQTPEIWNASTEKGCLVEVHARQRRLRGQLHGFVRIHLQHAPAFIDFLRMTPAVSICLWLQTVL